MPRSDARTSISSSMDALRAMKRRLRRAVRSALGSLRDQLSPTGGWTPEPILVPVPVRTRQHRPMRRDF